jgi:uncharacterized protein (TIGR02646 family)
VIFVDRSLVPEPVVLAINTDRKMAEMKAAAAFYRKKPKKGSKSFSFKVYKDPSVKRALESLFHGKCAYCESTYGETHPVEVEHWRPKKQVEHPNGKKALPGYYWLAADWNNLLPSCIHCNRSSHHRIPPNYDVPVKLGKGNRFPLRNESTRAKTKGREIHEDPLLLNPCRDQPEEFLVFPFDETRRGIVQARPDRIGQPQYSKAETSIEVYGLNREGLVRAREARFLEIALIVKTVERIIEEIDLARDQETRERLDSWLKEQLVLLEKCKRPEQPYAQLARQFADASLKKINRLVGP